MDIIIHINNAKCAVDDLPDGIAEIELMVQPDSSGEYPPLITYILKIIDIYYGDSFCSPFILDVLISGEEWASDMGNTPKERIYCAIIQIEQQLLSKAV